MLKQVTNFTILYFEKRDEFYISYQHNSSKFNMKAPLYKIEYALLNKGLINKEQLDKAKDVQAKQHIKLEDALVKLGFLTYSEIIQFFSSQYDLPVIDLDKANIAPEIINLIPLQLVKKHNIVPVSKDNGVITIAVSSPPDLGFIDNLRFMFNADFKCVLTTPENIKKAINKYYEVEPTETVDTLLKELTIRESP
ncbi:MAG: gspE 1, partial [Candidatus Brocadiaceae bacterium]|nr:gspE 1 [Candidatus Brocadiaceae bacterium]